MVKHWKLIFLLLSLMSTIAYFYSPVIDWALSKKIISSQHLHFLTHIDKKRFHQLQYKYSDFGSANWLASSQLLAKTDATKANELGDYYYSLDQKNNAYAWYQQAVNQGNVKATKPLAKYLYEQGQWEKSLFIAKQQQNQFWAQTLIVKIATEQGKLDYIGDIKKELQASEKGQLLFGQLTKYQIIDQKNVSVNIDNSHCLSIQFFATNLDDLVYMSDLILQIKKTAVGKYFCFVTPLYISKNKLSCQNLAEQAIRCNESIWNEYINTLDTRYLGVILPEGGANVHSGILYLDKNDDVNVFKHELLHLLGFVDEYPLPENHPFCQSAQKQASSHNVVVLTAIEQGDQKNIRQQLLARVPWGDLIKPSTPIVHKTALGWQIGTPDAYKSEIGLFPAESCQNDKLIAVKPIIKQTALTYFELPFPLEYQQFLAGNERKYIMPSFHLNVANALNKKGDVSSAQQWLIKAIR